MNFFAVKFSLFLKQKKKLLINTHNYHLKINNKITRGNEIYIYKYTDINSLLFFTALNEWIANVLRSIFGHIFHGFILFHLSFPFPSFLNEKMKWKSYEKEKIVWLRDQTME